METGEKLRQYNENLVRCLNNLRQQRQELQNVIDKEEKDRASLQVDVERISYKLASLNKFLSHRNLTKQNFDRSIQEVEKGYANIVNLSGTLLSAAENTFQTLENELKRSGEADAKSILKPNDNYANVTSVSDQEGSAITTNILSDPQLLDDATSKKLCDNECRTTKCNTKRTIADP